MTPPMTPPRTPTMAPFEGLACCVAAVELWRTAPPLVGVPADCVAPLLVGPVEADTDADTDADAEPEGETDPPV